MLGRLGPLGIDVHDEGQAEGTHCADCRPTPESGAWEAFVESFNRHHGLVIPRSFKPGWCK